MASRAGFCGGKMNTLAVILSGEGESVFITLCKIGVAFILGGIIGLERESKVNRLALKPA
ncbi:Uncharacterised protein [Raoultella ornithinolytica]|nr:Uncharacterised protein [Raoultella ornithinolytica]